MEWIRMIWDFHGPHAEGTAEHHAIHLKQFAEKESLEFRESGSEIISESHHIAYLVIQRTDMILVRDALRPNRATTA
jgi:hypothetical protein